jgi:hypothetical protein
MKFKSDNRRKLQQYSVKYFDGLNMAVSSSLTKRSELGFMENARSEIIGLLEKRKGHSLFGNDLSALTNYGLFDFFNSTHTLIRVSKVGSIISVYRYIGGTWVQNTGVATNLSGSECDFANAYDRCFIVNGENNNFYLEADTMTAVSSTDSTGMLYNAPKARLVNYFRDRLYLGDYLRVDGSRERTGICFSSPPLGIVSLVSGDHTAPITTVNVTDTKYIKVSSANDSLDVYRGGTLIGTLTVTGRTENSLTVSSFGTDLKSSDELWVAGTRSGEKKIRWDNRATGINVREYDSFKNANEEDLVTIRNVNNTMMIFTENSISVFNGSYLKPLDLEIGCISKNSFVKILGQGFFLHSTGLYATSGGVPKLISAKIQPIFTNANIESLRKSCAATDGTSYFGYIGQVTFYNQDGTVKKVLNDTVIEYNIQQNNFFLHTDVPMSHFISFVNSSGKILVFAKHGTTTPSINENLYINESITITVT